MARNENPPFERGTYAEDGSINPVSSTDPVLPNLEGKTWVFEDYSPGGAIAGQALVRSNRYVVCMCVRNLTGGALLPGTVVTPVLNNGIIGLTGQAAGVSTGAGQQGLGVVDEYLPAAGVPNNCLFWVVVEGPTKFKTPASGAPAYNVSDPLTTTSGGAVVPIDTTQTGATLYNQILNCLGRSATALLSGQNGVLFDGVVGSSGRGVGA